MNRIVWVTDLALVKFDRPKVKSNHVVNPDITTTREARRNVNTLLLRIGELGATFATPPKEKHVLNRLGDSSRGLINRIMDEREQTRENYSSRAKPETNDFLESASANPLSFLVNASLLSSLLHTDTTVWVMAQNRSLNIIGRTALRAILKIYCTLLQW